MIRRLFVFLAVTLALAAAAVWLADRPGEVTIHWQGWRVDTSAMVLVVAVVALVAAVEGGLRLALAVLRFPGRVLAARRARRLREGYQALSDGLAAAAVGDSRGAGKLAKRADRLLADPALTGVLTVKAAELAGDDAKAEQRLTAMLERPQTAPMALEGLMAAALRRGDRAAALDFARRAWDGGTATAELAATLFELQAEAGQWAEAEQTLALAGKRRLMDEPALRQRRALVLEARAALAEAEGDVTEAAALALKAHAADPAFVPATVRAAGLLHRLGKERKAAATIEQGWRKAPHPDLLESWRKLAAAETPLGRVKWMERLLRANPDAPEGHVALAAAAVEARLWGQARRHAEAALRLHPSDEARQVLARAEAGEQ